MTNFQKTINLAKSDSAGVNSSEVKTENKMTQKEKKDLCRTMTSASCIEVVSSAERMREFLMTLSHFEKNSLGNVLLIHTQRPQATKLKEYGKWEEDGKHVKKGARGIMILEPVKYKDNSENERNGFSVKTVFDIFDLTTEEKVPSVSYDCKAVICAMMENSGVRLESTADYPRNMEIGAYYDIRRKIVVVEKSADKDMVFIAVAKALAHAQLSKDSESYNFSDNDFTSKCTAFTLACKYGFSATAVGVDSIPTKFKDLNETGVKEELSKIHFCVREISDRARNELARHKERTYYEKSERERR